MIVESHTIGSTIQFPLVSANVSKSGLLLTWDSRLKVPFQKNTIIEMCIDPTGEYLESPLICLGKVVRKISETKNCAHFGVRIVQIDPKDQYTWEGMIHGLGIEDDIKEN